MLLRHEAVNEGRVAEEFEALKLFLYVHQDALLRKLEGVDDEDAVRPGVPSGTSLLGLVNHLTYVHHGWFHERLAKQPAELVRPANEWNVAPDQRDAIIARYRAEVERSRRIIEGSDPYAVVEGVRSGQPYRMNVRFILLHMIEEIARHNGHADIIREQIDGAVGQ